MNVDYLLLHEHAINSNHLTENTIFYINYLSAQHVYEKEKKNRNNHQALDRFYIHLLYKDFLQGNVIE